MEAIAHRGGLVIVVISSAPVVLILKTLGDERDFHPADHEIADRPLEESLCVLDRLERHVASAEGARTDATSSPAVEEADVEFAVALEQPADIFLRRVRRHAREQHRPTRRRHRGRRRRPP